MDRMSKLFVGAVAYGCGSLALMLAAPAAWAVEVLQAPDDALESLTAKELHDHVKFLASDELGGRKIGSEGNDKAAAYIGDAYKAAGLQAIGDDGTWLQAFEGRGVMSMFGGGRGGALKGHNVVGWLEGRDPKLKDEYVVVGAHYDHLGMGGGMMSGALDNVNAVHNGADDNASGTSTVLELAEAFGELKERPKRSILFICFDGEESGLLGSAAYVRTPIKPIENAVFMLNLDMVGRMQDKKLQIIGTDSSSEFPEVIDTVTAPYGLSISTQGMVGGDSDHSSFLRGGVPAVFFFTGIHPQYHRATDDVELINAEGMEIVAKMSATLLWHYANQEGRPELTPGAGQGGGLSLDPSQLQDMLQNLFGGQQGQGDQQGGNPLQDMLRNLFGGRNRPGQQPQAQGAPEVTETPGGEAQPRLPGRRAPRGQTSPQTQPAPATPGDRPLLGVSIAPTDGGPAVVQVVPGSPADKAGIQQGDVLVSWDGDALADLDALRGKVAAAKWGESHAVVVDRGGEEKTLTVVFAKDEPKPEVEDF